MSGGTDEYEERLRYVQLNFRNKRENWKARTQSRNTKFSRMIFDKVLCQGG
jgi:hypothetical protein